MLGKQIEGAYLVITLPDVIPNEKYHGYILYSLYMTCPIVGPVRVTAH